MSGRGSEVVRVVGGGGSMADGQLMGAEEVSLWDEGVEVNNRVG